MVLTCCVCKWISNFEPRRLFHRFPDNIALRKKWLRATKKTEEKIGKKTSVCSKHFRRNLYVVSKVNGNKYLKDGSVPTLHLSLDTVKTNKTRSTSLDKKNAELPVNKCEKCNRNFITQAGFKSHIKDHHGTSPNNPPVKRIIKKTMEKPNILRTYGKMSARKTKKASPETPRTLSEMPKAVAETPKVETETPESDEPSVDRSKIKFQCPKCDRVFNVYFIAYKHIQKFHCVDNKGKEVSPDSPNLIKPIEIEQCEVCTEKSASSDKHVCPKYMSIAVKDQYSCLGCDQTFDGLTLFEVHLKGMHCDAMESFFFQEKEEFLPWKTDLESQTRTKFVKLNQSTPKQVYHCTYQPVITTDDITITQLCPSSIVVQQLSKGLQVSYFGKHSVHSCEAYNVPEQYKAKTLKPYLRDVEEMLELKEDDEDLYVQFKKIMNSIVIDSAKLNITTLNILKEKALEMTSILNSYNEDSDSPGQQEKNMTDEQITSVLKNMFMEGKRKRSTYAACIARDTKVENDENSNQKSNGEREKEEITSPLRKRVNMTEDSPSSFNESYKNFVSSVIKPVNKDIKKKEIVKTRMGQFKPNSPTSKKVSPDKPTNKRQSPLPKRTLLSSNKKETPLQKKRMVKDDNIWRVKPDTEYEVRERDNDCNILVLKI